jgi:hypothetical protein
MRSSETKGSEVSTIWRWGGDDRETFQLDKCGTKERYVTVERGGTAKTEPIQVQRRSLDLDNNRLPRSPHTTSSHSPLDSQEEVSPRK